MKKIILTALFVGLSMNLVSCATKKTITTSGQMPIDNFSEKPKPNLAAASETNIEIALLLLKKGDPESAKQNFLRALRQAPNNPEAWYSMAYYYEYTGNSAEAERDYRKAISLSSKADSGAARNNYGAFLCREKRYQEGVKQALMAANSTNYLNTAEAYENAGLCAERIPDTKQAILYFQKALQIDPKRAGSLYSLAKLTKRYHSKNGRPHHS